MQATRIIFQDPQTSKNYNLHRLIGRGAFGTVYSAESGNVFYALNVSAKEMLVARLRKILYGIVDEVFTLMNYPHPAIVRMESFFKFGTYLTIALEHGGRSTTRLLREEFPLSDSVIQTIMSQVAQGMEHLHSHGIIHKDLKPDNILIDADRVKICDLGLVDMVNETIREERPFLIRRCGTMEYMAPEIYHEEGRFTTAIDIWSFGATLFELASKVLPYQGKGQDLVRNVRNMNIVVPERRTKWIGYAAGFMLLDPESRPNFEMIIQMKDFKLSSSLERAFRNDFRSIKNLQKNTVQDPPANVYRRIRRVFELSDPRVDVAANGESSSSSQ